MEKSIETIWKEGFISDNKLVAPKVNDIYNRKSRNFVEQFIRYYKRNLIFIFAGAFVVLLLASWKGMYIAGMGICVLLLWIVWRGWKSLGELGEIDTGLSSYDYIIAFDAWLQEVLSKFGKIYRVFYPALFVSYVSGLLMSPIGQDLIEHLRTDEDVWRLFGIPVLWVSITAIVGILMTVYSQKLYEWDYNLMYGGKMRKLKEIIADMEELRKE